LTVTLRDINPQTVCCLALVAGSSQTGSRYRSPLAQAPGRHDRVAREMMAVTPLAVSGTQNDGGAETAVCRSC
jgi:hypothetical protein